VTEDPVHFPADRLECDFLHQSRAATASQPAAIFRIAWTRSRRYPVLYADF
jgi:hypothetical protein